MFIAVTMESAVFMGKNFQNNHNSIVNTVDLTLKQMFDISTKLVTEQDEISGLETIGWDKHSWKYLSLIDDERIINLQRTKVYVFSESVLCLGKIHENPQSNTAWEEKLAWFKSSLEYKNLDRIDGEPIEFEWNIFPGFTTLQLSHKVQELLLRLSETPENFTGRIISHGDQKTIRKNVNQLSLYGAVAEMCEEFESYHDRTERPVVGGQSSSSCVPSVIKKTNVLLNNDDPAHQEFLLQRYEERIEKLSQQDRLSKFCTDAGFLTTVEVGQYFIHDERH